MSVPAGFWGLVVEPSKLYSQTVPSSFKITMAVLQVDSTAGSTGKNQSPERSSVMLQLDEKDDFLICSLTTGRCEQQQLDLFFNEGEVISFRVEGSATVHLTGYYVEQTEDFDDEEDEDEIYSDEAEEDSQIEYESEEEEELTEEDSEVESKGKPRIRVVNSEEDLDSEDDDEDLEEDSEIQSEEDEEDLKKRPIKSSNNNNFDNKKIKEQEVQKQEAVKKPTTQQPEQQKKQLVQKQQQPDQKQKPQDQKPKGPEQKVQDQKQQQQQSNQLMTNKKLPNGLEIQDIKAGNGQKIANGKTVMIHYKGTLLNGSCFDSSHGRAPLKFRVGKGEVIKGMDMGIVGMNVGGTRRLIIPANLGYGNQNIPKIPKNSTLIFEIKVEKILS